MLRTTNPSVEAAPSLAAMAAAMTATNSQSSVSSVSTTGAAGATATAGAGAAAFFVALLLFWSLLMIPKPGNDKADENQHYKYGTHTNQSIQCCLAHHFAHTGDRV